MSKQTKITKSARQAECQIRIPGVCEDYDASVVHAHKNGGGMGMKSHDILGARGCAKCHDAVDGRAKTGYTRDELLVMFYEGIFRTQLQLIDEGLIEIK